jgi:hypothetical protein
MAHVLEVISVANMMSAAVPVQSADKLGDSCLGSGSNLEHILF